MEFTIDKQKEHIAVIKLDGRLVGEFQTIRLNDQVDDLLEDNFYHLIFDLSQLEYMNSSGLNFLLKVLTRVRKHDGEVVLCTLNSALLDLLVTTKLNLFFTICSDVPAAIGHFMKENPVK